MGSPTAIFFHTPFYYRLHFINCLLIRHLYKFFHGSIRTDCQVTVNQNASHWPDDLWSADAALWLGQGALAAIPAMAKRGGRHISLASIASAKSELNLIEASGAVLFWRDSEYYPNRLAQYDDAPACITAKGNLHLLTQPMIAIVGARNASINAQHHAQKMAAELGQNNYIIVSGMARGIDTAAHRGALQTGTIGVVAGGIDMVYPPENANLFDEVAERGLLLAEMPPGTQPTPRYFPIRNRVIASLALGVVVAEAAHRSGSLITAREPQIVVVMS